MKKQNNKKAAVHNRLNFRVSIVDTLEVIDLIDKLTPGEIEMCLKT
jgi:hypothetical protein